MLSSIVPAPSGIFNINRQQETVMYSSGRNVFTFVIFYNRLERFMKIHFQTYKQMNRVSSVVSKNSVDVLRNH